MTESELNKQTAIRIMRGKVVACVWNPCNNDNQNNLVLDTMAKRGYIVETLRTPILKEEGKDHGLEEEFIFKITITDKNNQKTSKHGWCVNKLLRIKIGLECCLEAMDK